MNLASQEAETVMGEGGKRLLWKEERGREVE